MRIAELIDYGVAELANAGVPDGTTDVHLLLCHCLHLRRTQLLLAANDEIEDTARVRFESLLSRRKKREPLAYILGVQEFWSREFEVSPSVLIPRPETEFMLEAVLKRVREDGGLQDGMIVDLCCGSGVIAVVLAIELDRDVTAIDISPEALAVAERNCCRNGVDTKVKFVESDLFAGLDHQGQCSLVVSNPPYVSRDALDNELEPEVTQYEPRLALDGGEQGLEVIQRLRDELVPSLITGGHFFMEIGADQGQSVLELFSFQDQGSPVFTEVSILQDYSGRDRVLYARK